MRLIIACTICTRQYNAQGRSIGSSFHCHCGEKLVVSAPIGHDASVVRCASCGGARSKGDAACRYCQASFTLHEQDLHTICPSCLARISDRASFCHHCGTNIVAETTPSETTSKNCPVCDPAQKNGVMLSHRLLGEQSLPILECNHCAGMWIGRNTFKALEKDAAFLGRSGADPTGPEAPAAALPGALNKKATGPIYRKCPECSVIMNRQNYGRISGIIIDICKDHGVWFDGHELDAILRWVRDGGLEKSAQREAIKLSEQRRQIKQTTRDSSLVNTSNYYSVGHAKKDLADTVLSVVWVGLRSLFR